MSAPIVANVSATTIAADATSLRTKCALGEYEWTMRVLGEAMLGSLPIGAGPESSYAWSRFACSLRAASRFSWTSAIENSPRVRSIRLRATSVVRRRPPVIASG